MAPFLLGDLGCGGGEPRLLDCPADDTIVPRFRDRSAVRDYREPTQECDAFAGTFAFVACGTAAQAGTHTSAASRCVDAPRRRAGMHGVGGNTRGHGSEPLNTAETESGV